MGKMKEMVIIYQLLYYNWNMKIKKSIFMILIIAFFILFPSCVSTTVQVNPDVEVKSSDIFYIAQYEDNLALYNSIIDEFYKKGICAELVYDSSMIPDVVSPTVSGSGFYIAPDIIVTNSHVINGENKITYYQNGIKHNARPMCVDKQNDIAILQGDVITVPYFKLLSSQDYTVTTPVFVLGYPLSDILGNEIRITNGIVNALSGIEGDTNMIQISAPIQPGNSGGPVVTEDYEVIGVATSKLSDAYTIVATNSIAQNVNFAIKSDLISFLASANLYELKSNVEYVESLNDAIAATVKIEAGGTELIPEKQYYIDFSYNASWDVIHWTLSSLLITCTDVATGDVIAFAEFAGASFNSADGIARELTRELIAQLY